MRDGFSREQMTAVARNLRLFDSDARKKLVAFAFLSFFPLLILGKTLDCGGFCAQTVLT